MELIIQLKIFQTFPDLVIGIVTANDINNQGESEEINQLLRTAETNLPQEIINLEVPSKHPKILTWRHAYKKFGSNLQDFRTSVEALARRVLKGGQLQHIGRRYFLSFQFHHLSFFGSCFL